MRYLKLAIGFLLITLIILTIFSYSSISAKTEYAEEKFNLVKYNMNQEDLTYIKSVIDENKKEYPFYILALDMKYLGGNYSLDLLKEVGRFNTSLYLFSEPPIMKTEIVNYTDGSKALSINFMKTDTLNYIQILTWGKDKIGRVKYVSKSSSYQKLDLEFKGPLAYFSDLTNVIGFYNINLVDSAENLEEYKAYTVEDALEGKAYGETEGSGTDTPDDDTSGILSSIIEYIKGIGTSLGNIGSSISEFFSAFGEILMSDMETVLIPDFDAMTSSNVYTTMSDTFSKKYPIIGQINTCVAKLTDINNVSPFAQYIRPDGEDVNPSNNHRVVVPNTFDFKLPNWSKRSNDNYQLLGFTGVATNITNWGDIILMVNKILSAILWARFIWKMYKRLPSMMEALKF